MHIPWNFGLCPANKRTRYLRACANHYIIPSSLRPYPERGAEQENGGGSHNTKKTLQGKWEDRWRSAAARSTSEAIQQPPAKRVLLLHEGLHKAESSIFTQIRRLADFLQVPEATTACACGYERETARHTTVFCPRYRATRNQLLIDGRLDFKRLLTAKEGVSKLTRWWIRSGKLNQFQLANELIK